MAQNRYYSSTALQTSLTAPANAGDTSIHVAATTGFPVSFPYTLALAAGTSDQEVITVTAASGTTLTVTRGSDGTAAVDHSSGAVVIHDVSARDYNEPQAHIAANSGVHGVTGHVVGTTDSQTLTNKAMTGAVLDNTSTVGGKLATALVTVAASQTLTNKTINGAVIDGTTTIHGIAGSDLASLDGSETLSNKTLTEPTIADFTHANHTHASAAQGGSISPSLLVQAHTSASGTYTHSGAVTTIDSHLTFTFTVPASGRVLVRLTGLFGLTGGGRTSLALLAFGTLGTQTILGELGPVLLSAPFVISGLTPGATPTWEWGWSTTAGTVSLNADAATPITEVWAA